MDMAFLLIGGYRALGRRPSSETRRKVIERDEGRCQSCGKLGSDLDHVDGSSDDPSNLQLLCGPCHRVKTSEAMKPADDESRALILVLSLSRVMPDEPVLLADDEEAWADQWRKLTNERKARFEESLLAVGFIIPSKHLSRLQLIAAREAYLAT
ncbi:HNH endonuclease [Cryobacterium gelidum]|uniref:HNH endonuclease n=2 Tax=Cryobacterium gelidum TaxID=1259164 RepID=A0A4R9AS42_9MICO|nr:HNH endonuclease [Cryobacterium gelidum]